MSLTNRGWMEAVRRLVTLCLFCVAAAGLPVFTSQLFWGLLVAGVIFYFVWPKLKRDEAARSYDKGPAIIIPDFLAIALVSLFFAMPFWAAASSSLQTDLLHPSAYLLWPMAILCLSILAIGWWYACSAITLEKSVVLVETPTRIRPVPYDEIIIVKPWKRGLPRWLVAMAPIFVSFGHYSLAGGLLIARDSSGIELEMKDGSSQVIHSDGLEKPVADLLARLEEHDIAMARGLSRFKRKKRKSKKKASAKKAGTKASKSKTKPSEATD